MSINTPFGTVLTIDKANLPEGDKWRDFYKHMAMGVMPIQSVPEPQVSTITPIQPELEIIPYMKLITKIQLLVSLGKIEPAEVGRLVSMLDSSDPEAWTLADGAIHQKLSQL